jgi:hypothetical protein
MDLTLEQQIQKVHTDFEGVENDAPTIELALRGLMMIGGRASMAVQARHKRIK